MKTNVRWAGYVLLLSFLASASGCIVAPVRYHDGYWDRDHNRYWYGGVWHPCSENGQYCR